MAPPLFRRTLTLRPTITRTLSVSSASSPSSSDTDPNDVVSSVVSILTNYRSKSRWATILTHYPKGFTPLQVSQILLRIRNNPNLAGSFFRFTTENALTQHDLQSFSTVIHIFARARKKSRVQALIRTAIRVCDPGSGYGEMGRKRPMLFKALVQSYRCCDSAPFVFNLLIRGYLELNRLDSCLQIVRVLQSGGFSLDLSTCNDLVSRVAKHRGPDVGYDLYRELFGVYDYDGGGRAKLQPIAATFNGLLLVCYQQGMLDKAEEIWIEMRRLKCDWNAVSYNILMAAYCDEGEVEKAGALWEEMKSKDLKRDIVAYNTLIGGWCKVGKVELGEELYREMEMSGIESTCVTYQHLIQGYCKIGDVSSALLLFKEMCRKGYSPDGSTIDVVVIGLCNEGLVSQALELFKYVMKDANFIAMRTSYEYLIKGLCGKGEMEEALKIQAEMVGKGFEPDSDIYVAFIDGYTKLGKTDMAEKLREEMSRSAQLCITKKIS